MMHGFASSTPVMQETGQREPCTLRASGVVAWNLRSFLLPKGSGPRAGSDPHRGGKQHGDPAQRYNGEAAAGAPGALASIHATAARAHGGRPLFIRIPVHD